MSFFLVGEIDKLKGHSGSVLHGIFIAAGGAGRFVIRQKRQHFMLYVSNVYDMFYN